MNCRHRRCILERPWIQGCIPNRDKFSKAVFKIIKKNIGFLKVAAVATIGLGTAVLKLAGDKEQMEQTEKAFRQMILNKDKKNGTRI